jgi:ABC-type glycerol-3-phosphate transport system permease component
MKRTVVLCTTVLLLIGSAIYAFGDIARPKVTPTAKEGKTVLYTSMTVKPDAKASEARLQISQATLQSIAREAGNISSDESMTQRLMHSSTRTIMAGLFMFLAVSFAGVWFARSSQRRNHKAIAAVILIAMVFGLATVIVRANAGPPGYIRWQGLPQNLKDGKTTGGGVDIQIVPGDDSTITLIVPLRKTQNPGEE